MTLLYLLITEVGILSLPIAFVFFNFLMIFFTSFLLTGRKHL